MAFEFLGGTKKSTKREFTFDTPESFKPQNVSSPINAQTGVPLPLPLPLNQNATQGKYEPISLDENSYVANSQGISGLGGLGKGVAMGFFQNPISRIPSPTDLIMNKLAPNLKPFLLGDKLTQEIAKRDQEIKDYIPQTSSEKIGSVIGNEVANLPLWMVGEGAIGAVAGKVAPKLGPLNKLPGIVKGGLKDAATYGAVVAPTETLLQGGSLTERERDLPLIFGGGVALRGMGKALTKGAEKLKPLELPELKINPLEEVQKAYKTPSLRDIKQKEYENLFGPGLNLPIKTPQNPLTHKTLQEGIDQSIKSKLTPDQLTQRKKELKDTFTGLKDTSYKYKTISPQYKDALTWPDETFNSTLNALKEERQAIYDDMVNYIRTSGGKGVEPGGMSFNNDGEVVTKWGRMSNNPKWYQDFFRDNGRKPTKAEAQELADEFLKNGFGGELSQIEPNESYINLLNDIDALEKIGKARGVNPSTIALKPRELKPLPQERILPAPTKTTWTNKDLSLEPILKPVSKPANNIQPLPRLTQQDLVKKEFGFDDLLPKKDKPLFLNDLPNNPSKKAPKSIDEEIQSIIANSDQWKDKGMPSLQRETWDRNIIDIAGKDGQKVKEVIFNPIHKNEADRTRWRNTERSKIANLKLSKKESEIVQRVGEGKLSINDIPQGIDKNKILNSIKVFREFYDKVIDQANNVLVTNGYKPVGKLDNYFPHFTGEDPIMKALGIRIDLVDLPTDINGLTHQFKPGKNWFGNFLSRKGDQTTFDAVEGFDRYIEGISKVIFHTDDIQRLRKFNRALRMKYSPAEIQTQVDKVLANKDLTQEAKDAAIDELLGRDKTHLSNTVADLEEYTNVLAGKKDLGDRADERRFGRQVYNVATFIENRIGKNMVAINPASWITNFIPVTQSLATTDKVAVTKALADTMKNLVSKDGFIDKSTFLTNRVGTDILSKGITEKVGDALSAPMKWADIFTSQVVTRAKYYEGLKKGLSPDVAMNKADEWAAKIIGDRSLGAQPTLFNQRSPLTRLFTQFQLEVNNQLSFLFKDLPREYLQDGKTVQNVAKLSSAIGQMMIYSYLFNNIYEAAIGRRPALDPIGIAFGFKKDLENPNLDTRTAVGNLAEKSAQQLPFFGGIIGGGRIPISSALQPLAKLPTNILDATTNPDGAESGLAEAGKNLLTAGAYIVPPFGGGQIKKTVEGAISLNKGGSFSGNQLRFPIEKTPENIVKSLMFGQYTTNEGKKYLENNRRPLSENQTAQLLQSPNNLQSNYDKLMKERRITTLKNKIKDIRNDKNIDEAAKDKQIKALALEMDKIIKE